jgi:eukaryotic translation initiation factor 2C
MPRDELRIEVDLDAEQGRTSSNSKNKHKVFVRWTRKVDISHLHSFLSGQAHWSTECIDAINALDHILREIPSRKYTQIKKSFFQRGEQRFDLGGGIEAFKGVFSSLRPVLNERHDKSLAINVDVANGTFWRSQELLKAVCQVFNCNPPQFIQRIKDAKRDWKASHVRKDLGRLKRVHVTAFHNKDKPSQWIIDEIRPEDCHEAKFSDPDDRSENPAKISIYQYYKKKYGIELTPGLPVVRMTKKIRKGFVYIPINVNFPCPYNMPETVTNCHL